MIRIFKKYHLKPFKYLTGIFTFLTLLWLPNFVFAAPQTVQDHLQSGSSSSKEGVATVQSMTTTSWSSILNTIVALAILVAIIYFGLKYMNRKLVRVRSTQGVQILVQQSLTTNRSIHVVDIAGQLYVLGVGDSITCLDKITDEETKAAFLGKIEQSHTDSTMNDKMISFRKIQETIRTMWSRNRLQDESIDVKETDPVNFQVTLERQLESMRSIRENMEEKSPQSTAERHDQT